MKIKDEEEEERRRKSKRYIFNLTMKEVIESRINSKKTFTRQFS